MKQTLSVPDGLASEVTGFAASHDIPEARAYELLVSVGLATLDGHEIEVSLDGDRLVLECPGCARAFDDPDELVNHDCDG